ncbi:MAG: hypothetical protein A2418_02335 [Candidatus Brennerbacteria bacterium RIFOXYC1_FULL_41_11]|uniref:Uncharacterized protein n=1 Tax=Candidatus Brennerbacteria bacterium RIFOXYD1_FULL_41_16 TaxID=1797529 RepID=A0A1G1XJ67_9BACT|nr:MAG: hypothetical protein UU61_C0004G0011 [Parcubacteria group bacterium GW2011_GWB1_41_4]OGY38740.1 MAG: hypothetical protein A2391_02085 [Candidatus Brennerbacteria bacterium RIFOXYB1_FULL_41_13]OGY39022.1 MAG: hypothetical protein A2418_02335 [Candidatus Brennerbacteria bacterium RIFOXYC1_FULL_41_11]OGY40175.1 MAG: hypothetical protein A2570_02715 [Candidatus Brennerbacteria bacterium RIFOXYD1_FULL_41_16]
MIFRKMNTLRVFVFLIFVLLATNLITVMASGDSVKSPEENEVEIGDFMQRISEETYKYFSE